MTLLPKVKLKTLPVFPSNIIGGVGLTSTKQNGAVTLDYAWQEFGAISAIPTSPTSYILTYDTFTNAYVMVPSHLMGGAAAGIADAPIDGTLYGRQNAGWVAIPAATGGGPSPSTTLPLMDGTATIGTSLLYARDDHRHPTDTSRAPLVSPVFTGDPHAPTPSPGDNDTSIATTAFVASAIAAAGGGGGTVPGTSIPLMDGTGTIGTSLLYARDDHRHPTDTSRAPIDSPQLLNVAYITPAGTVADDRFNGLLRLTKPAAGGQYINFVRSGLSVYSMGFLPNSNIFGFGVGNATDAGFNPSLRLIAGNAVAMTGQPLASFEVAQAESGNWFGTSTPNITYHSVAGDAVNHYFTQQLIQFTSVGGPTTFESGLVINFINNTGYAGSGSNNNGKGGLLIAGVGQANGASMWLQANDMIINPGWSQNLPGQVAYNTEIDTTNASGYDSVPDAGSSQICSLVIGGAVGSNPISAGILFQGDPSNATVYSMHWGLAFGGVASSARLIKDITIVDNSNSNASIAIRGAHASGIAIQTTAKVTYNQIFGTGFNIDPDGNYHGPSDISLKNLDSKLEGALDKLGQINVWRFHWKLGNRPDLGLVAQEVREVFPEFVGLGGPEGKDGKADGSLLTLNYMGLVAPLIAAVQELHAEINHLKASRINAS